MEHNRNNAITMLRRLFSITFGIVLILSLVPSQALGQTHEGLLGSANELLQRLVSNVSLDDRTDSPHSSIIDVFLLGLTGASNRGVNVAPSDSSPNDMQVQDEYTGGISVVYRNTGGGGDSEEFDAQRPKINFVIYGPSGTVVASKLLSDFDYNPGKTPPTWIVDNLAPGTYTIEEQNYDLNSYKGDIVFSKNATKINENSATIVVSEYNEEVVCVTSYFKRDGSGGIRLNRNERLSNGDPVEVAMPTIGVSYVLTGPDDYSNELSLTSFQRIEGVDEFALVDDLKPGAYTICEVHQGTSGYSVDTSYTGVDSVIQNIATFSVKSGEISNIVVTDTYTPAITGTMDITKMVDGIILTTDDEYRIAFKVYDSMGHVRTYPLSSFTKLSINVPGSIKTTYLISINGLTPGEYTIVEENANKDGYTLKSEFTIGQITGDETNNKVNISPGQKASVRVTNTYIQGTAADNGSLRLEKYVSGADLSDTDKENMRFVVVGPEGTSPKTETRKLSEFHVDSDDVGEHEFSLILNDVAPGVYDITEEGADLAGYTRITSPAGDIEYVSPTEVKVAIGYAKQSLVHFNNFYSENSPTTYTGGIRFTKLVSGAELTEVEKNQTTFTIVGPQETTPKTRSVRYDQFDSGSFTINNLEPGTYEITENYVDKDGYGLEIAFEGATALATKGKATVKVGDTISDVIITNNYESNAMGSIVLTKTVDGDLSMSDLTKSQKDGMSFVLDGPGGKYAATLSEFDADTGDPSWTKSDLIPGTYTIAETGASIKGYDVDISFDGATESTEGQATVTVKAGEPAEVAITNTYKSNAKGSIVITKKVSGDLTLSDFTTADKKNVVFVVEGQGFRCSNTLSGFDSSTNPTWTITDLTPGTYTITETGGAKSGYSHGISFDGATKTATGKVTVKVEEGESAEVTITNSYKKDEDDPNVTTHKLKVTNTVSGAGVTSEDKQKSFSYKVKYVTAAQASAGKGGSTTESFELKSGESKTFTVASDTSYEVTQTALSGFDVITPSNASGTMKDKDITVSFKNTKNGSSSSKGKIVLAMRFVGDLELKDLTEDIRQRMTYTLVGPDGTEYSRTLDKFDIDGDICSWTITDLEPGDYKLSEVGEDIDGYNSSGYAKGGKVVSKEYIITVTGGKVSNVELLNIYADKTKGMILLTKRVAGDLRLSDLTDEDRARIKFTLNRDGAKHGEYKLSEFDTVFGDHLLVMRGLTPGEYVLTESGASKDGYKVKTEARERDGVEVESGKVKITAGAGVPVDVTVTNTYTKNTGSIVLTKKVAGDLKLSDLTDGDKKAIKFVVEGQGKTSTTYLSGFESGTDPTWTITDLTPGTYTITETGGAKSGYTHDISFDGATKTATGKATVKVEEGESAEVTITNSYKKDEDDPNVTTHKLKVTNTVSGTGVTSEDKQKNFAFKVKYVTAAQASATKGGSTTESFELKSGESKTFDAASDTSYEVTQTALSGFEKTTPSNASGTMKDKDITVSFKNTKKSSSSSSSSSTSTTTKATTSGKASIKITATKKLTGRSLSANEFSFELKDNSGSTIQTKTNSSGGSITFDSIEYTSAGTYYYTITEVNNNKTGVTYDTHSAQVTVTVTESSSGSLSAKASYSNATFNNTYKDDSKTTTSSSSSSSNSTSSTKKDSDTSSSSSTRSGTTGSTSSGSGTSGSSVASTSGRTASTGTDASTVKTPAAKTPGTADPTLSFAAPALVATGAAGIAAGAIRRKRR